MNTKTPGQNRLKQNKDCRSQKHLQVLRFEYRVLSLDIIWSGICNVVFTLQSLNRVLAERRRVDSYKSCNWLTIETVETSKRLEGKAMHFVAFRKLNSDTSATISELPFSFLSLWVEKKNNRGWWLRYPNQQLHR